MIRKFWKSLELHDTQTKSNSDPTRVYRAMTEEVPCERSRVSGGNSSNVEEELSRNFQIPPSWCTAASLAQSTSKLWKQWQ